jgi:RNA polymerase sigma-70 factor (ECF subfamily)
MLCCARKIPFKDDSRRKDALSPKNPSTVDHTLLARVAKGDQEAFERLYEQTSSLLYTLVVRIVGKPADAADLLQEVYLEAWRKASNYDTARGAPMAWLVTLARSRAIDWVRALAARGKGVTASLDDTPASDLVAQNADALDIRAANERQALVRASLKSLPPVQQQVIELAFYEGLTHTEISERLNVPLGTIKTRIRLAMEKLRDGLQPLWEEELGIPN